MILLKYRKGYYDNRKGYENEKDNSRCDYVDFDGRND